MSSLTPLLDEAKAERQLTKADGRVTVQLPVISQDRIFHCSRLSVCQPGDCRDIRISVGIHHQVFINQRTNVGCRLASLPGGAESQQYMAAQQQHEQPPESFEYQKATEKEGNHLLTTRLTRATSSRGL